MKKLFKKSLAVLLVVVLTLTAAPLGGFVGLDLPNLLDFKAEAHTYPSTYSVEYSGVKYSVPCVYQQGYWQDTIIEVTGPVSAKVDNSSYSSSNWARDVIIQSSIAVPGCGSYPVTIITDDAFISCHKLTSITIPNSITYIGDEAFHNCTNLTSVTIPNSVKSIGDGTFSYCTNLTNVTIPNSVKSIGDGAFSYCGNLASVTIGNGVTSIGSSAFYDCDSLTSVTIPNSVTSIGSSAFHGCESLTSVTIPNSVTSIDSGAFYRCNKLTSVIIGNGVTSIGSQAFYDCDSLTSVTIPNSVTSIGSSAFHGCESLTSVTIPNSVTSIDSGAFYRCNKLTSVIIGNGVTSIGSQAFYDCDSLANLSFGNSVTSIGYGAFYSCDSLTKVILPDSVTSIGDSAFFHCSNLEYIHVPVSVTSIGRNALDSGYELAIARAPVCSTTMFCYARSYALTNGLRFKLCDGNHETDKPTDDKEDKPYKIHGRDFKHNLDYFAKNGDSSKYDPELANMLAALSDAVYNENDIREAYEALGFDNCELYDYDGGFNPDSAGYALAFKQTESGETICLVTVRGSSNVSDWVGNVKIATDSEKHIGFSYPADRISNNIQNYMLENNISGDVKYFVTGHSRGAAVANLVSVNMMEHGISSTDIYNYNYACPDVACKENFPGYANIFNLCNSEDIVPKVPGYLCNDFTGNNTTWDKFGRTYWFTKGASNPLAEHDMKLYLEFTDQQVKESELLIRTPANNKSTGWVTKVKCPVDVIITDKSGKNIASVINGEINYYDSAFGEVLIFTDGDKKAIYIDGDNDFNVNLVGTDSGEMTYTIEQYNIQNEKVLDSKTFENVKLEKGKEMQSAVCGDKTADDVSLYVYENNDGDKTAKYAVNTDGSEIEIGEVFKNFAIKQPSVTTINYGDTLVLCADIGDYAIPAGYAIEWLVEGAGVSTSVSEDGMECRVTSIANGNAVISAKIVSENGEAISNADGEAISDEITLVSKAGFWQKFVSFFKNLFGINRVIY